MQARTWAAFALFDLAEAAADAGDVAAATGAAEELIAVADVVAGLPLYRGFAAAGSAWAALAGGDGERAARVGAAGDRAAVEHRLRSSPGPGPRRARAIAACRRALGGRGRARAGGGDPQRSGGSWRRRRSLEALRRLGSAGRRAAAAALGPGSLTRREREVARLAATGMSAKDIAGTLFVGERTVESHLASVYAKLGVESKLQLVRRAAELGLS